MNNKQLSDKLTKCLNKLDTQNKQRLINKVYVIGGKPYKLVKQGNEWHKIEVN